MHRHTGVLFSHKEKIKYVLARKLTEPETVILSKVSQSQTEILPFLCHTQNTGALHTTPHLHTHHESGREANLEGVGEDGGGKRMEKTVKENHRRDAIITNIK